MPLPSAGIGLGENISPPFTWSGIPPEAAELALIMEDLDVPLPRPIVHTFVYGISPDRRGIEEGALKVGSKDLGFGKNLLGMQGYVGPGPIPGHGPHRYVFHLLALKRQTRFQSPPGLKAFWKEISGTVIAHGHLVGVYER